MERGAFHDDAVLALFSGLVPVRLDVDLDETAAARERFKEAGGVPELVLVDCEGIVLWRALGSRPAAQLMDEVRAALAAGPPADAHDPEAVRFRECVRLLAEGRNAEALAATERYLGAHDKRAEAVRLLRARAGYAIDGRREAWLDERIAALISVFDHPWPGDTLGGLLKRALGKGVADADADRWVTEQNDAGDALAGIGGPAVDALLRAMRDGSPRVAERCGWVIGRIRSPSARTALLGMATEAALPAKSRIAVATAMAGYKDARFLDLLATWVRDRKQAREVRYEAASALRMTLAGRTDLDSMHWAAFLLDCLGDRDVALRGELLQALLVLEAPYDLAKLAPLLGDERIAYLDVRVADLACWCVLRITGKRIEGADEATPDVVAFVRSWFEATRRTFAWNPEERRYAEPVRGR